VFAGQDAADLDAQLEDVGAEGLGALQFARAGGGNEVYSCGRIPAPRLTARLPAGSPTQLRRHCPL
jgi:hypothetical protein